MPLPAPLSDLPARLQHRAVREITAAFAEVVHAGGTVDAALAAALTEAGTWRERYPAVAEYLSRRAVRLAERFRKNRSYGY